MKNLMILFAASLLITIYSSNISAQVTTLPEVTVLGHGYRYLKSIEDTTAAQPIRLLQERAATFDVKNSDYYEEDYDNYFISFYIPDGVLLATYDKNGRILRTAEKYNNVALPKSIGTIVGNRFPNWKISKDVYLVNYYAEGNPKNIKKQYKILLENGSKRLRVKITDKGEFIE